MYRFNYDNQRKLLFNRKHSTGQEGMYKIYNITKRNINRTQF